jgi:hypothetical protein
MKPACHRPRFAVLAIIAAVPMILLAPGASAEQRRDARATPFVNAVTAHEMAALRGGSAANALPSIRLWDELAGRGPARPATPGAVSFNGGTLTIRVGGR